MNVLKMRFLVCTLIAVIYLPSTSFAEMLCIKGDDVNMRKGPGKDYSILWEYGDGFPLQVIDKKGDWVLIEDFEQDKGWVHSSVLSSSPHMIVKANKNSNRVINIRKEPNTSSATIAQARYGVVLKSLEQKNGWAKVVHEGKNIEGWVKRSLLWGF